MLPQEMNSVCRDAFVELVFQNNKFHGKTYCYFHPFRGKNPSYHITITEQSTGYGVVVPLTAKSAMILEKPHVKEIFAKVLDGLLLAVDKHGEKAHPVDYKKFPIQAEGRKSKIEKVETNDRVTVEVYGWSQIVG